MNLKIVNIYNQVSELLKVGKVDDAHCLIESTDFAISKNNIVEYLRAVCNQKIGNIEIAIKQYTNILDRDPSFVVVVERLLELNKASYSIGELKYFYELILSVKPDNKNMRSFIEEHSKIIPCFNTEPNLQKMKKSPHILSTKELQKENKYLSELVKELEANGERYKKEKNSKNERKITPIILPDVDAESDNPQNKFIEEHGKDISTNNGNSNRKRVNVETLTIANLYIKQGYYKEALDILYKLEKQSGNKNREKIIEAIDEVNELIENKK